MIPKWLSPVGLVLLVLLVSPAFPLLAADPDDEAAVKAFVQTWLDVFNKQDVDGILALVASDAKIDSLAAGGKVKKELYAAAMKVSQSQGALGRNAEVKITSLTFPSPVQAILDVDMKWDTIRDTRRYKQRWTLIKREGRWLILESEYK
jgi:hypothetical protein